MKIEMPNVPHRAVAETVEVGRFAECATEAGRTGSRGAGVTP